MMNGDEIDPKSALKIWGDTVDHESVLSATVNSSPRSKTEMERTWHDPRRHDRSEFEELKSHKGRIG